MFAVMTSSHFIYHTENFLLMLFGNAVWEDKILCIEEHSAETLELVFGILILFVFWQVI